MKTIVIPRDRWAQGAALLRKDGDAVNYMLSRKTGRQCCLGHLMSQLGWPDDALRGRSIPKDVEDAPNLSNPLLEGTWACTAMEINDDPRLSDEEREAKLIEHAKRTDSPIAGFEFVGEDV